MEQKVERKPAAAEKAKGALFVSRGSTFLFWPFAFWGNRATIGFLPWESVIMILLHTHMPLLLGLKISGPHVQCPREVSSLLLLMLLSINWQTHILMRQIVTFVLA